jgi:apolipoprotein D and lipocalin family protein
MGNRPPKNLTLALASLALLLAAAPTLHAQTRAQSVSAVTTLDESRIQGTWYEIARYPYSKEKRCVSDARELIAPGYKPNQLLLVDACRARLGDTETRDLTANAVSKNGGGEFKVRTFWPFWRKYWVLALSPDYSWTVLGSPNHKTLWVFSKTPALQPEVLAEIEAKGAAEGFPSSRLVMTPQTKP